MLRGFAVIRQRAAAPKDGMDACIRKAHVFLHANWGHPSILATFTDWRDVSHIVMKISCPSCGASFNIKPEALGSAGRKVKCGKCSHLWLALPDGAAAPDAPAEAAPIPSAPIPPAATPEPEPEPEPVAAPPVQTQPDDAPDTMPDEPESEPDLAAQLASITAGFDEFEAGAPPRLDTPIVSVSDREGNSPRPGSSGESPGRASGTPTSGGRVARRIALSALTAAAASVILVGSAIFLQPQITSAVPATTALYAKIGLRIDIPGLGLKIVDPKSRKRKDGAFEVVGEIRNVTKDPLKIPTMQARLLDSDGEPLKVWLFRAAKAKIAPGEAVKYKTEFRNPPNKAERLDITFTRQDSAAHGGPELARGKRPQPKKPKPAKKRKSGR